MENSPRTFSISASALKIVTKLYGEDCITLRVGKKEIKTSLAIGCFIFPKVFSLVSSDSTVRQFFITETASEQEIQCLEYFLVQISNGDLIDTSKFAPNVLITSSLLTDNQELIDSISAAIFSLLQDSDGVDFLVKTRSKKAADFVAERFTLLKDALISLPCGLIVNVLRSQSLALLSEEELLDFSIAFYQRTSDGSLFEFVRFEFLTPAAVQGFMRGVPFEALGQAWPAICRRLELPLHRFSKEYKAVARRPKKYNGFHGLEVPFESNPFEGLFHVLNKEQILDRVSATCADIMSGSVATSALFTGLTAGQYWGTNGSVDVALMINFKGLRIRVTGYSLKATNAIFGGIFLTSWLLEGRMEEGEWREIERVNGNGQMSTYEAVYHKDVPETEEFNQIRFKLTAPNTQGTFQLALNHIELFGFYSEE
jgi:hypothetical protein